MNKVIQIGNVGRDPESRFTPNGKQVGYFSLAVSRKYTGSDGQKVEETMWFDVSTWNPATITFLLEHVKKGMGVAVEGRLDPPYVSESGNVQMKITANEIEVTNWRNERVYDPMSEVTDENPF